MSSSQTKKKNLSKSEAKKAYRELDTALQKIAMKYDITTEEGKKGHSKEAAEYIWKWAKKYSSSQDQMAYLIAFGVYASRGSTMFASLYKGVNKK